MRLFLAIDLPDKIKEDLHNQLHDIQKEYADFNWVTAENYHITIQFYGEVHNEKEIKKKLEDALYDQESFYLYSTDVDLFMKNRITIYLNFRREKKIEALYKKLEYLPEYNQHEKFIPHLTIARCRIPSKQQYFVLKKKLHNLNVDISFPVKKLCLFESKLGGKKPAYTKINKIKLLSLKSGK